MITTAVLTPVMTETDMNEDLVKKKIEDAQEEKMITHQEEMITLQEEKTDLCLVKPKGDLLQKPKLLVGVVETMMVGVVPLLHQAKPLNLVVLLAGVKMQEMMDGVVQPQANLLHLLVVPLVGVLLMMVETHGVQVELRPPSQMMLGVEEVAKRVPLDAVNVEKKAILPVNVPMLVLVEVAEMDAESVVKKVILPVTVQTLVLVEVVVKPATNVVKKDTFQRSVLLPMTPILSDLLVRLNPMTSVGDVMEWDILRNHVLPELNVVMNQERVKPVNITHCTETTMKKMPFLTMMVLVKKIPKERKSCLEHTRILESNLVAMHKLKYKFMVLISLRH